MQQNCAAHRRTSLAACAIGFGTSANVQSEVLPSRRMVVTAFKAIVILLVYSPRSVRRSQGRYSGSSSGGS
jgi:hypothetical protein